MLEKQQPTLRRTTRSLLGTLRLTTYLLISVALCLFTLRTYPVPWRKSPTRVFPPSKASLRDADASSEFNFFLSRAYRGVVPPATETYTDMQQKLHILSGSMPWTQPLGQAICLIDVDPSPVDAGTLEEAQGSSNAITPAILNHHAYASIHNYTYQLRRLRGLASGRRDAKMVFEMARSLHHRNDCRFVVFLNIYSSFRDLALPMEWIFNRWGITSDTRMAVAATQGVHGRFSALTIVANTSANKRAFNAWAACLHHEEKFEACQAWGRLLLGMDSDAKAREQEGILVLCDQAPLGLCAASLFHSQKPDDELDESISASGSSQFWTQRFQDEFNA